VDHALRTERLLLRRWRTSDRAPFAAMNADPLVMEHFPSVMTTAASDAFVDRIEAGFGADGYGLWAVDVPGIVGFVGFVGLLRPNFEAHFTPAVEVGWRLASAHWGRGYATEAGRAALEYGFTQAGLDQIVSMTTPSNVRSQRVMQRLGMSHDPADDFDHPRFPPGHPVCRHVLYRLEKAAWTRTQREL
jgi:RimJ/RimL family protein N-acetyltransferase